MALLLGMLASVAAAQLPRPVPAAPAEQPASREQIEDLVRTLEDPATRDALIARLKALTAAAPDEAEDGAFAGFLRSFSDALEVRLETAGETAVGVVGSVRQVPILARWLQRQLAEPKSRELWLSVVLQTGAAVLAGLAVSLAARVPLRRWRNRVASLPLAARRRARLRACAAHLAVDLLALAVFLAVTSGVLAWTEVTPLAALVAADVLIAVGLARGLTAFSRALLAADGPRRRLPPLSDAAARDAQRWLETVLGIGIYGYFALAAAGHLGLPWTVHAFLARLLFLVVAILLIVQTYSLRGWLVRVIEGWAVSPTSIIGRYLPWQTLASIGPHLLAAWIGLVYLVWAVGVRDGAVLLTRGFVVTLLALLGLRILHVWLDRRLLGRRQAAARAEDGEPEAEAEPPSAMRVAAVTLVRATTLLAALGMVLLGWGLDVLDWLRSDVGRAVLASLGRIAIVLSIAFVVAQIVQVLSRRYINALDDAGQPVHSNRTRTLVSMARNVALTVLGGISIIQMLSEVGVNANALLAGAGVVGLAIGFGSQRLVQDLITGLFILVGDTVRVGDVVDLGGKSGVVEAISMRTITLRDYNGNVHTVPYSSIRVVTNMTKEFSFAVFEVAVAYREDPDRVMDVLRELDTQLRREWPYRRLMLEPLDIAGVDQFRESSVIIKARSKVRAGEQWKVGFEFNRRLKRRFEELGIEVPYPAIHIMDDRGVGASPAAVEALRRQLAPGDA